MESKSVNMIGLLSRCFFRSFDSFAATVRGRRKPGGEIGSDHSPRTAHHTGVIFGIACSARRTYKCQAKAHNMSTFHPHRLHRIESVLLVAVLCALSRAALADATITVEADKPGHAVSPLLWGIFFEDINLSADGGLYPELVRNRSFEDSREPEYWKLAPGDGGSSEMAVDSSRPLNAMNPHCLRINVNGAFTLENDGYWGMNIIQGDTYSLRLAARAADGFNGPLKVKLAGSNGQELAAGEISGLTGGWKYYTLELVAAGGDPKAKLQIAASGQGRLFLDMVSLLPHKTWKDHGLRVDLAQALAALHPAFMRFPGGNWIEGDDLAHIYHWKNTIGDVDARTPLWNTWGYNTTQGLGFHEYLQLCEDLGAQPLFDINGGMSHAGQRALEPDGPVDSGRAGRHRICQRPDRIPSGARCAPKPAIPARSI